MTHFTVIGSYDSDGQVFSVRVKAEDAYTAMKIATESVSHKDDLFILGALPETNHPQFVTPTGRNFGAYACDLDDWNRDRIDHYRGSLTKAQKTCLQEAARGSVYPGYKNTCESLCRLGLLSGEWEYGYAPTLRGNATIRVLTLDAGTTGT